MSNIDGSMGDGGGQDLSRPMAYHFRHTIFDFLAPPLLMDNLRQMKFIFLECAKDEL